MRTVRARVRNGRMIVDEPTDLPDGTELDLILDEDDDIESMDSQERAELEACLDRGLADAAAGRLVPAEDVLARLRAAR